ncbi:MAG: metal-dependent transcriptional regulator [Cellulomonas sp.]
MSVSELSTSTQNYLKVIWVLQEWTDEPVTTTEIAAKMGLTLSTVSVAIRKLGEQGLVDHARYGTVTLTGPGHDHAVAMVRRHRLMETFLVRVLHYRWDQVHDEAEHLEHAVSDMMVDRIDDLLGHPARDPHGDPIPAADGTIQRPAAVQLSRVLDASSVLVERIADDDPELLQFLADRGIGVGTALDITVGAPFSDAIDVRVSGSPELLSLGRSATAAVWVSPVTPAQPAR